MMNIHNHEGLLLWVSLGNRCPFGSAKEPHGFAIHDIGNVIVT